MPHFLRGIAVTGIRKIHAWVLVLNTVKSEVAVRLKCVPMRTPTLQDP